MQASEADGPAAPRRQHGAGDSPHLAPLEFESRAQGRQRPGKAQTAHRVLGLPAVVDAGHDLLSEIATLGVAHRLLGGAGLLRDVRAPEILAEAGDSRLHAQDAEGARVTML